MVFEIIDSIKEAVEIYAISISHNSLLREHIHERLCELLGVDVEEFKPFDDVGITKTPTKEEAEQILWDAIDELTGRRTLKKSNPFKIEQPYLRIIWLVILSCWTFLTIFILINIQELPHPNPVNAPEMTAICWSLWISISILIWLGLLVSFNKVRERETIMQSEKEKKI